MTPRDTGYDFGRRTFGASVVFLGAVTLAWRDFAAPWHPVAAETPFRAALACIFGVLLILGGVMLATRRGAQWGGGLLCVVLAIPVILWGVRVARFPAVFGTWAGLAEQGAILCGAVIALALSTRSDSADRAATVARYVFGLCCLCFGAAHFSALKETAAMVPGWMPFGGRAWAALTGAAHVAGGLAILGGLLSRLAAQLLAVMFALFGLLCWAPMLVAAPQTHMNWSGFGITFLLVGAALLTADWLALFPVTQRGGRRRFHR